MMRQAMLQDIESRIIVFLDFQTGGFKKEVVVTALLFGGKLLYGRNVGFLRLLPFLQFLPCLFRPTVPAHFLLRSLNIGSLHSVRSKAEGTYQQCKSYFYSDSHLFNYKFLTRKTEQYPFIFYPYARSHRHRAPSHPALPLPAKELVRDALSPFVQSSPHLR